MQRICAIFLVLYLGISGAAAQFSPGCGSGFCGLLAAGGGGSGFNGGKSQVGLNSIQIADDFAAMNAVKGAQNWGYVDNTSQPDPNELDTDGYPVPGANAFSHGGVYTTFYVPLQTERPGNYACKWNGISDLYVNSNNTVLPSATFTGSVTAGILTAGAPSATIQKGMRISTIGGIIGDQITGSAGAAGTYSVSGLTTAASQSMTITGGSKTGSSATGNRYVFSTTAYRFQVGFSAATQTPSALQCFHVDDEIELDAGQFLGKKFRDVWAYLGNPGVVRFLDWGPYNTTSVSTWATRKPTSYVFYQGHEMRLSMWGGITTNVGDAYTAPITPTGWPGFVDKATIIVRFNASATTDASTLTVAGTTKNIRDRAGDATSVGNNTRPSINRLGILIYDAVLDCFIKIGGDLANSNTGLNNGVPPEVMLQVATKLGAHLYVPQPYLAADPITDYMRSFATMIRDTGPSWMIPRYEGPNENWNNAADFYGTRYAWNKANAYWGVSTGHHQWYGKTMSLLGQDISTVYSNDRSKYWVIAGVQTSTACNAACSDNTTSSSDQRLSSATWVASGPDQVGYTRNAAYNWVTHVALANYVNPGNYRVLQELRDGFEYVVTNAGNPTAQNALADAYAATLESTRALMLARAQKWYGWAQNNWGGSIKLGLTAYEGGYSPDYSQTSWTSPVTGATVTSGTTVDLTLATTSNPAGSGISGNPAVVGMSISLASVGGMTQLNGNTYTVAAVSGSTVTLTIPSTAGFGAYTSGGTATYVNSPLYTNTLRWASKFSPSLQAPMTGSYADLASVPVLFPSQFLLSGLSINIDTRLAGSVIGASGTQIWGLYDQSVYATPYSPAVESIRAFNLN